MPNPHQQRLRTRIAQEAARLLLDEGIKDHQTAKRKAAERFDVRDNSALPSNLEIEQAVQEYQEIFFTDEDRLHQQKLQQTAYEAMKLLDEFKPWLVGSVLEGTAGKYSDVNLHVYADSGKEIIFTLLQADIPYQSAERRLHYGKDAHYFPVVRFMAGDIGVEVAVLPVKALRQRPASTVDGKPMRRADLKEVAELINLPATA